MTSPIPATAPTATKPAAPTADTLEALQEIGTLTPEQTATLRAAVHHRRNIIIVGPPRSGRTTLLRALIQTMVEFNTPTSRIGLINAGVTAEPPPAPAASPVAVPAAASDASGIFAAIQMFGRTDLARDAGQSLAGAGLTRIAVDDLLDDSPAPYGTRSLITLWQRIPGGIATILSPERDQEIDPSTPHSNNPASERAATEHTVLHLASHFLNDTDVPADPAIVPSRTEDEAQKAFLTIQQSVDLVVRLDVHLEADGHSPSRIQAHLSRVTRPRSRTMTAGTSVASGAAPLIAHGPLLH